MAIFKEFLKLPADGNVASTVAAANAALGLTAHGPLMEQVETIAERLAARLGLYRLEELRPPPAPPVVVVAAEPVPARRIPTDELTQVGSRGVPALSNMLGAGR